jgi:hypothetical protein
MTRKDYEVVALAMRRVVADGAEYATVDAVVRELSLVFAADNPRFSEARFEAAVFADWG